MKMSLQNKQEISVKTFGQWAISKSLIIGLSMVQPIVLETLPTELNPFKPDTSIIMH